jgi:hypothetical protein
VSPLGRRAVFAVYIPVVKDGRYTRIAKLLPRPTIIFSSAAPTASRCHVDRGRFHRIINYNALVSPVLSEDESGAKKLW